MDVVPLSEVEPQALHRLWPQYLPLRKIIVIDGLRGQGKSTLLVDIAARLSRGLTMPDGSGGGLVADSLIITYEGDVADTVRPRLDAAGGDTTRVHHVRGVSRVGDDQRMPAA